MDARTGKKIRLGRLFDRDSGRTLVVAYSHGCFIGPLDGMRSRDEIAATTAALHLADGLLVSPGMIGWIEDVFVGRDRPSLVVHLDWMNYSRHVLPPTALSLAPLATVEQVVAAGADAIMSFLYFGDEEPARERLEVERTARLARECDRLGVGLIIEPRSARRDHKDDDEASAEIMSTYCRMAAELGADVVKCVWKGPDEDVDVFRRIVDECPVPVLLAGGPKRDDFDGLLDLTDRALATGLRGLVYGRNVFEADDPEAALSALRRIVHG